MKYRISGAAALISAAFFAMSPLHAEDVTAQTVVATINGTQITVGHLIAARQSLPPQYQSLTDEQLYDGILNQIVQQEILKQSAGEIGEALKYQIENEERVVIAGSMLETIAKEAVNDASLKAAYDAKFAEFEPDREYHAAHILVETEDEAKALEADLEAGADFADLAREKGSLAASDEPEWSDEQLVKLENDKYQWVKMLHELGHDKRYWDDIRVGDKLPTRIIGPHSIASFTTEWRAYLFTIWCGVIRRTMAPLTKAFYLNSFLRQTGGHNCLYGSVWRFLPAD